MTHNSPLRRVLMTADTLGGVWTYSLELARALVGAGVEVALATLGGPLSAAQRAEVSALGLRTFESEYRLEWMRDPWADVDASGQWLQRLAQAFRPDVVHLCSYSHGSVHFGAPSVVVAHSDVFSWWHAVHGGPPPQEWNTYHDRVRSGLHQADAVVAITHAVASDLARWYGFHGAEVICNARHADAFPPRAKEPVILGSGRLWDEAKNLIALDAAAPLLRWPVYLAGCCEHPATGEATRPTYATSLGQLTAAGMSFQLGRAGIYALPARYEPFGLSVLEAALAGCALVLGDIPSLRELWHGAAVFVQPDDREALVAGLNVLTCRDSLRSRMAILARNRALSYSPRRMLSGYIGLYSLAAARWQACKEPQKEETLSCAS